jgi:hypothetical protein
MGRFVIVAYRPYPGKEERLLELTREHLPILRSHGRNDLRGLRVEICRGYRGSPSESSVAGDV